MPIDPELLAILVCPETKQSLSVAGGDLLQRVNAAIAAGRLNTRGGDGVTESVTEGLLRDDGHVLYPIRQGIPIMLIDESIEVDGL